MKSLASIAANGAIVLATLLIGPASGGAADCRSLVGKSYQNATIIETDDVSSALTITGLDAVHGVTVKAPFCRVRGIITPSADSNITFEVWLPTADAWNGKYEGIGNGGFAGSMIFPAMSNALKGGYGVSGTVDIESKSLILRSLFAVVQGVQGYALAREIGLKIRVEESSGGSSPPPGTKINRISHTSRPSSGPKRCTKILESSDIRSLVG